MLRIISRSAEEIQSKQNEFPFFTEYAIKINDNKALKRHIELCSFCESLSGSQNNYVKNAHLYIRRRYYTCEQEREKLIHCPVLHSLCVGVWVCLNSMPIYIQSHMGAIYELGIYNADTLNIYLLPTA